MRVVGRQRDDRGDGERDEADAGDLPQAVPPRRPASALLAPPAEGLVLFLLPAAGHGFGLRRSALRQHRGGEARHGPAVEAELPELAGARPAQHQQDREIAGRGGGDEPGGGERDRHARAGRRVAQFEQRGAEIAGRKSRKEKRTASSRRRPAASPATIVLPEREIPGTMAMPCATPMRAAFHHGASLEASVVAGSSEEAMRIVPVMARPTSDRGRGGEEALERSP